MAKLRSFPEPSDPQPEEQEGLLQTVRETSYRALHRERGDGRRGIPARHAGSRASCRSGRCADGGLVDRCGSHGIAVVRSAFATSGGPCTWTGHESVVAGDVYSTPESGLVNVAAEFPAILAAADDSDVWIPVRRLRG